MLSIEDEGMRRIVWMIFFFALIPLMSYAGDEDDCLYDQAAFKKMYAPIKEKYRHTKFLESEQALEIRLDGSKVIVRYYGCEHYATEIKYIENKNRPYSDKEIFDKTIDLVTRFGQRRINPSVLDGLLTSGKYEKVGDQTFLVNYPLMDEFSINVDRRVGIIEIGFYN